MSRPAGFSDSDEDSEYEQFDFEPRRRRAQNHFTKPEPVTPEEQLLEAVRRNDVGGVRAALAKGADVHHKFKRVDDEITPIMEAASEGHLAVMEVLIQNGASANDEHKMTTVLMRLCTSWSKNEDELLSCLRLLLEHGADPKATNWTMVTPIMMATRSNHILLVKHLVEVGCDVNAGDSEGITPLMIAFQNENLAMIDYLLGVGANVNIMDKRGNRLEDLHQVNTNPLLAALLGIQLDTGEEIQQPAVFQSSYKRAMASAPNENDRLYGYHEDAVRFVKGIGLYDVAKVLEEKDVQLAQLLTWSDEDWDRCGVEMSFYKRKMALSVKKYHEQPWGKGAIPKVSSVISEGQVDLFLVVSFFLDFLRVQHISSATSLYMLKNFDGPLSAELKDKIKTNLEFLALARQWLQPIKQICLESAAKSVPPDLITKKEPPKRNFCLNFVGISLGIIFVGSSLNFISKHLSLK